MIELFSDFDGTLTDKDTLALLLDLYASSDWYAIEKKALDGEIDERQSLADEMALITASDEV
ncbi:2,3-diketo-5-methylthio-1-phosphopentane phosphatase, partial [bacterium]|nr:2,3-diketo-5-methylthio-1-phosphopentane phosphatase [bacterium]